MSDEIVNRVAESGIIQLDLSSLKPNGDRIEIDIKDQLWQGVALKEKEFRTFITNTNWANYTGKHVAIHCSADAIIPTWAYMLLASALQPHAATVFLGNKSGLDIHLYLNRINEINTSQYNNERVVVKGCGDVPTEAYVALVNRLQPVVKTLMFGEPCSTVPVYKKPK